MPDERPGSKRNENKTSLHGAEVLRKAGRGDSRGEVYHGVNAGFFLLGKQNRKKNRDITNSKNGRLGSNA